MARVRGRTRALIRLLGVQAAWNYERMQGTGMGHAAEPVLRAAFADDRARYRESLGRASAFFNANPYLAAAAVGAEARAEADGAPGPQVERLRIALCGPLGSLGDRLFWTGLVPGLAATFTSHIELEKDDLSVNAKSIMGVMMLAAESGSTLKIRADGEDEDRAVSALADLVASGFGET